MTREQFFDSALERALALGCDACEVFGVEGEVFSVGILDGEIDSYNASDSCGLGVRVQLQGKNGYAYTEDFQDVDLVVKEAMRNAEAITSPDERPMQSKQEYQKVTMPKDPLRSLSPAEKIDLARKMEQLAKEADERVKRVSACTVANSLITVRIKNTLGLDASETREAGYCVISPVVEEKGRTNNAYAFRTGSSVLDIEGLVKEAVERAVSMLSATPVRAGQYKVLLSNQAATDILQAFLPMFSADNAQKGLSLLANREGETIAAPIVTIVDDPFHPDLPRAFDGEGTPCVKKDVVKDGVLKTLLHNLKTAKKANTLSTGNGGRGSAASPVGISPTNFYILPGEKTDQQLLAMLGDGLYINDVSGLHAGVNTISGEFSLLGKGYLVRDGKRVRAVERITIAGTFLGMMKSILAVGDDVFFDLPGSGRVGSPALLVESLQVSGEE